MKRITLYSPASRNNGEYVDAGETLTIGDAPAEITAVRAKDLTDSGRAASETAAARAEQNPEVPA